MGVTKKPAVVAKTARKVRISASEAAFAKASGITLEEFAKSKLPKRGRPKGSKNKPKALSSEGWVPGDPVDWEKLAKRLQEALAAQIKEAEAYKKLWEEVKDNIVIAEQMTFLRRLKLLVIGKL